MSIPDANTFLMAGSTPSVKFNDVGAKVSGEVISSEVTQQTDIQTNQPKTWDDGKPMWQLVVTLATDERDAEIDGDDGTRKLYLKGSANKPDTSLGAVKAAVKAAGASSLEPGGRLQVVYTGDGEATKRGFNPPKEYAAEYAPPVAGSYTFGENEDPF
jgi:hypothetical protein